MREIFETIKNFFIEIAKFIKDFMGPDLSESELLGDEYNNEYSYQKLNGFNQLGPEDRKILDEAMKDVVYEDSKMGMEEALKEARKNKLSLKNAERQNTRTKETTNGKSKPEASRNEPTNVQQKNVDKDR